jgi:hypothetical protein
MRRLVGLALAGAASSVMVVAPGAGEARFRDANGFARGGDYPKAIAIYSELAASGAESASLYWNWAQASRARGASGEALWALLRARELEPGEPALERLIEEVRAELSLDAAELSPEPLAAVARFARRFALGGWATALAVFSLLAHAMARLARAPRARLAAAITAALALAAAAAPLAGALARPVGVVVRRGAPLLPAASPTSEASGALREGEVVPLLGRSSGYVRIEDSSGARGWALVDDVRGLDEAPPAPKRASGS